MIKLKIITLTWNGKDKLEKLYPTLLDSLDGIDWEWHIRDHNSKDETVEKVKSWNNPRIKLVAYHNNLESFSQGCNFLFKEANPNDDDYVLFLNNDIIFNDKTSIKNMIKIMENDDSVGVVGARLLYTNTNKIQHCGVVINSRVGLPMHFRANQENDANAEKNREFQIITGAVLLTKAKYFRQVNQDKNGNYGYDLNLFWAFDDCDLSLSIKYGLNKKVVYCGETNIFHEESASLKKNPANKLFMNQNISNFKRKWKDKIVIDEELYTKDSKYNLYKK